ncbi:hypothetical protein ASD78_11315 [Lysobacter sp. Root667]|uniref:DUF6973 domain-containing protein n=1 Tax=Lysobacter sp. Root667 TaxID=1736581 RepID=UPI0006FA6243|nr:hypothetical protein [Lysobacter sp. Root667]KRA74887.1 hypothetical protein ASD78_11315 [Lysobacter sp. Root667]
MADPRPNLNDIRTNYQVSDDEVITYHPRAFGAIDIPFTDGRQMTKTEGALLDRLTRDRGLAGLSGFRDIAREAFAEGERRFPDNAVPAGVPADRAREWQGNDGHRDAFRHAYWSARLAQEYGPEWGKAFTTAHEGLPGNWANREAMDLYNNSIGNQIGAANRNATPEQLANLIGQSLDQGKLVLMNGSGNLEWSDRVRVGQHGLSPEDVIGPKLPTPGTVSTDSHASLRTPDAAPGEARTALAALDPNVARMREDPMYQQVVAAMRTHGMADDQLAANLYAGAKQKGFDGVTGIQPGHPIVDASGNPDRNVFVFDGSKGPSGPNYAMVSENQARGVREQDAATVAVQTQAQPQAQTQLAAAQTTEQPEHRKAMG